MEEKAFGHEELEGVETIKNKDLFVEHLETRFRGAKRRQVRIRCDVEIVLRNWNKVDYGRATMIDLSATGAFLTNFDLNKKVFPAKPFYMRIRFRNRDLRGWQIVAEPVRLSMSDGKFGMGVRFIKYEVRA